MFKTITPTVHQEIIQYFPILRLQRKKLVIGLRIRTIAITKLALTTNDVFPLQAYNVALNSGIEDSYRDIIPQSNFSLPDYLLLASVYVDTNAVTIPIRSAGDATKTVWFGSFRHDYLRGRQHDDQGRRYGDLDLCTESCRRL